MAQLREEARQAQKMLALRSQSQPTLVRRSRVRAAELVTLAGAHGIDLTQAAKQTTRVVSQRQTAWARIRHLLEPNACTDVPTQSATGRHSHVATQPAWSLAELGQAAHGVPRIPFLAAMYAYAGDRSCYWPLHTALTLEAVEMRLRWRWPSQVPCVDGETRYYLEPLAALVLDEDANLALFRAAPMLYALCLRVDSKVWERSLAHRFEQIRLRYQGWLSAAESTIQERISEDEFAGC